MDLLSLFFFLSVSGALAEQMPSWASGRWSWREAGATSCPILLRCGGWAGLVSPQNCSAQKKDFVNAFGLIFQQNDGNISSEVTRPVVTCPSAWEGPTKAVGGLERKKT